MAISKAKESENPEDIELLKSDVASFSSSIGLSSISSSLANSGFDDSDFRKTGPLKPKKSDKTLKIKPSGEENRKLPTEKVENKKKNDQRTKARAPPLSVDYHKPVDRWKNLPKLPLMKVSSLGVWYVDAAELEEKVIGKEGKKIEAKKAEEWKSLVAKKKELAERLLAQYTQDFETSRAQSGDIKMLMATQRSGTAADKVSAFSVMVGENPIANVKSLDALLAMVTSKVGKRHALTGFEALKELFLSRHPVNCACWLAPLTMLPACLLPDRKLKSIFQRPLSHLPESKDGYSLILFWYWEECLKQRYERFVFAIEEASRDMLPILKDKALKTMYALLRSKSEQERRLLSALVNKLGDPENKGASNADFHLSNLLSDHPNMKAVVIAEVDSFLFRPHLGLRAKYHAVNFLSQIRLSHKGDGPKVAKRLVDVYFALFKVLISEAGAGQKMDKNSKGEDKKTTSSLNDTKGDSPLESNVEMDSRLLSVLLTGVNRAFPFVASDEADDVIEVQTPMLFKLVHSKNFNVGVQALMLLDKLSSKNQIVSDRFYRALYSKLLLPSAMNSSKAEIFIGLLLRAMKSDVNLKRVSAFSKRLLQVEVLPEYPGVLGPVACQLVTWCRVNAMNIWFVKVHLISVGLKGSIIVVALQQSPQYACGCLFLLSEVLKARPPLWNMMLQNELIDEDLEHFEDIIEETENEPGIAPLKPPENTVGIVRHSSTNAKTDSDSSSDSQDEDNSPASYSENNSPDGEGLLVRGGLTDVGEFKTISERDRGQPQAPIMRSSLPGGYNPRHREPSYCNADHASWWELMVLASHVHPSVATMARTLLSGANIVYNGNPLNDLSLTAFLDKFMEKKPKPSTWHGGSQIEPAKKLNMNNHLIGAEILSLAEVDVPPEDLVFHKFYMNKMSSSKKPKKKKKKKGAEDEAAEELFEVDGGDESDNEEIENMLDSGDIPLETDGHFDYDDLDRIVDEDDDDLLGNASDAETGPLDLSEGEDDTRANDDNDDIVDIGDADDGTDDDSFDKTKRKRKAGASPFASLEDYDHLLNDDSPTGKKPRSRKKPKSQKKRSSSN
ncbi:hypothetical protein HHK36_014452 [Tetracentron sinense]|uniref:CCAAT-binding factor domain-containing protein n=1 Tax=Tetracentron sinense TaxID=13715 RepID=A0A835DE92_TETSI|nr:hypothetical protein HHK36_014452 [Tetracentron sinense]